ncbi:MAG: carboxymuconolactone decarboxylase family protein, partial [Succinivibrio sp.]
MKRLRQYLLFITLVCLTLTFGGRCMADESLSVKERNIAVVASYTAQGKIPELEQALKKALDDGLSVNELKEVLVQMYAYTGFPRSLNALNTLKKIVDENKNLNPGPEGVVLPDNTDKFAYGDDVQFKLTGRHLKGGIFEFAPAIDKFLKEHLFADIFARGVLSYKEREIATISALSSMNGVDSQLRSHIICGKNTGLSDS